MRRPFSLLKSHDKELLMTTLERVSEFLTKMSPNPYCDQCITDTLQFFDTAITNRATRELAQMPGFDRGKDKCSACGRVKIVIRCG